MKENGDDDDANDEIMVIMIDLKINQEETKYLDAFK